jgi:ADP-ribosylglycohydrolase
MKAGLFDKYLGCVVGAAAGDALGSATEPYSTRQIKNIFGGRVEDFMAPPLGALAGGRRAGQVTDAFSIPYVLSRHIISANGKASRHIGAEALREWGNTEWFAPFAGMTTRNVVKRLLNESGRELWSYSGQLGNKLFKGHYYALSSNGAAVKAWPAALLHPADLEAAIQDTVELTMASHDDPLSISGACAISAAISRALGDGVKLYDIVEAALYGAKRGEELALDEKDIRVYPGPSVTARLGMAIDIAVCHCPEEGMDALRDLIGCGPPIAETVPTALGLLLAREGRVMEAIFDGANIGDETSAIASLIGAVGGAWKGVSVFPEHYLPTVDGENGFSLRHMAEGFLKLGMAAQP